MNKKICLISLLVLLAGCPSFAHGHHHHRYHRVYHPIYHQRPINHNFHYGIYYNHYRPVIYRPAYYYSYPTPSFVIDTNFIRINVPML